jgi:hypothetical protein
MRPTPHYPAQVLGTQPAQPPELSQFLRKLVIRGILKRLTDCLYVGLDFLCVLVVVNLLPTLLHFN